LFPNPPLAEEETPGRFPLLSQPIFIVSGCRRSDMKTPQ
jgi:hypothetical protein